MRGRARRGGRPACTACGVFSFLAVRRRGREAAQATGQAICRRRLHRQGVTSGGHISAEPRINERIRVPEVRLVGPAGEQVGIVSIDDALRLAQEADLDLVEVAPTARPPVAKLMDYGKFKYESALKARESRKNQAQTVIKEIKLRPKIDPHDYGTKKGHVERFLKAGDKVKVTIMFRGREQSRPELGFRLLQRLANDVEDLGFVETSAKQDGRNMTMVIGPHRRKADSPRPERPEPAQRSHPERAERAPQVDRTPQPESAPEPEPVLQPEPVAQAQPQPEPEPVAQARPEPEDRPAPAARPRPAARPAPAAPAEREPQTTPDRAPARPVPGPRAVAAASATRRANGGSGNRQQGEQVSTS
ncbi:MAG: translation initiation factor IF-3 [Actinobacteria bacterium]|nr:translation initiation factor IF-3 [Actinomycetota bacterium]